MHQIMRFSFIVNETSQSCYPSAFMCKGVFTLFSDWFSNKTNNEINNLMTSEVSYI